MIIQAVKSYNTGRYECTAVNQHGQDRKTLDLNVPWIWGVHQVSCRAVNFNDRVIITKYSRNLTKNKLYLITPDSTELKPKKDVEKVRWAPSNWMEKNRFFRWEIKFDGPFHSKFSEQMNVCIILFSFLSESLEYHCTIWWWNTPFVVLHLGENYHPNFDTNESLPSVPNNI